MQSGYGVSEIQQFMADGGCCSPLFSISTADIHNNSSQPAAPKQHHHHHHSHIHQPPPAQLQQHHHHHHYEQHQQQQQHVHLHHHQPQLQVLQQQQPVPQPQLLQQFHHFPITQQLFQQTSYQLHMFHQEQQQTRMQQQQLHLGHLDQQESRPDNSSSSPTRNITDGGGGPPFLGVVNFKLAVKESGGGGGREGLNVDEEGILQEDDGSEGGIHRWPREEESAIKEPFWIRPMDVDNVNRNNKRCKEKQLQEPSNSSKQSKKSKEGEENEDGNNNGASNYKLFSELEAIYKPGEGGGSGGAGGMGGDNHHHQTRSGSELTGEDPRPMMAASALGPDAEIEVDHGRSNTSTGEEAAPANKKYQKGGRSSSIKRKRKRKQQLRSIASFLESLVRQLIEHQEGLHRKFLEVMERRDQERMNREDAWRRHEAAKSGREAMARAQEQVLASTREAAIISFLEKMTGESLNLPNKAQLFQSDRFLLQEEYSHKSPGENNPHPDAFTTIATIVPDGDTNQGGLLNTNRWPKAEVQALIQVRSEFESRFQEPGLKGPLWEEVSSTMASLGYHRSAKRCKEKWENINKYFRKTKDSVKRRSSQQSKTCPYFHQLDQLYSKSFSSRPTAPTTTARAATTSRERRKDNSELLDAIVESTDQTTSFMFNEMGSIGLDYGGSKVGHDDHNDNNNNEASGSATAVHGLLEIRGKEPGGGNEDDEEDEEEDQEGGEEGDEEGEGETQQNEAAY